MAASSGPDVIDAGLVLAIDAADRNSFDSNENLALNSEAINSWGSNGNSISISANSQIAPDGTLTADVLSQTAVTGASRWTSSMTRTYTAGVTYTLSIWLKKISGTDAQPGINLWVEGGTSQSVGTITTEWVRYSKSFTPASTISSNTFTGLNIGWNDTGVANNFTFSAWGFQVETGSSAGPYYPTTGTTKTRGSTLIDLTGRGNTGTLTNGPTYSSSNGGSIVFDGTNDYVVTSTSSFSGALTFSFWINGNIKDGLDHVFISLGNSGWDNTIGIMNYGNNLTCFGENGGFVTLDPSSIIMTANWINVVITQSSALNATITSYLNGVFGTQGSIQYPIILSNLSRYIGMRYDNLVHFGGKIAQVQIYNRALTASEVQQNFNATRSRFGI